MAKAKATPKPKKTVAKAVSLSYAAPGQPSRNIKFKVGQTLNEIFTAENISLEGYEVTVNGVAAKLNYTPVKDDVVRVGIKTKHGRN